MIEKHVIKMPLLNANEHHVSITKWYVKEGEWVDCGTVIATIETVKVTMDIETDFSGYFFSACSADKEVAVGEVIAWILTENQPQVITALKSETNNAVDIKATSLALKLINEHNLSLSDFAEKKFVTEKDVMTFLAFQRKQSKREVIEVENSEKAILLYCAGNYAEVLYDAVLAATNYFVASFIDYSGSMTRSEMCGLPVYHPDQLQEIYSKGVRRIHINTNDPKKMKIISEVAETIGFTLTNIIHPQSAIAVNAILGKNVYVGPSAIVGPSATVGDFTKILNGASVAHHASVGAYVQVSDGARISGHVQVGDHCIIGLNAAVNNHVKIGSHAIVVSMANVTQNIPNHCIWRHDGKIVEKKNA